MNTPQSSDLIHEIVLTASRSSGPGGQNVNKVNTKVTLKWNIINSRALTSEQRELLLKKLSKRLTAEGVLTLVSQDKRTQLQNKENVLLKLDKLLLKAFTPSKVRKATSPGQAAVRKRIESKKRQAEKKQWRRKLI